MGVLKGGNSGSKGINLGLADNIFASTTGSGSVQGMTPATDKASAESIRDTYATNNSVWLSTYDNDYRNNILLYYYENSDTIIEYQNRTNNIWSTNVTIEAIQGQRGIDGTQLEFASEAERDTFFNANKDLLKNRLPILVNQIDAVEIEEWRGDDNPSSYDSRYWKLPSFRSSTGSIELDRQHTISSGGQNVFFKNNDSNINWFPVWQGVGEHSTISDRTIYRATERVYESYEETLPYGGAEPTGAIDYDIDDSVADNTTLFGVDVILAENVDEILFYELKENEVIIFEQECDVTGMIGDEVSICYDRPLELRAGDSAQATIKRLDGSFVKFRPSTGNPTIPYRKLKRRTFEDKQIALAENIRTDEEIEDIIGTRVIGGDGISSIYNDTTGETTIESTNVFGTEFEKFENLSESSCGAYFTDKLDITTAIKPAGVYRIGFNCEITETNSSQEIRFLVNGTPIHNHSTGNDELEPYVRDYNWDIINETSYITLSASATIEAIIQHKNSGTGKMSNAIIEIWRVS